MSNPEKMLAGTHRSAPGSLLVMDRLPRPEDSSDQDHALIFYIASANKRLQRKALMRRHCNFGVDPTDTLLSSGGEWPEILSW